VVPGLHNLEEKDSMDRTHTLENTAFENASRGKGTWKGMPWSTMKRGAEILLMNTDMRKLNDRRKVDGTEQSL